MASVLRSTEIHPDEFRFVTPLLSTTLVSFESPWWFFKYFTCGGTFSYWGRCCCGLNLTLTREALGTLTRAGEISEQKADVGSGV